MLPGSLETVFHLFLERTRLPWSYRTAKNDEPIFSIINTFDTAIP
jgi:hypothetical protein